MKKIFFYIMCILMTIQLFSCSVDEQIFSCDPELNSWVKNNYQEIQNFTTIEFLNLDYGRQKAAYTVMEMGQRHNLWMTKLKDVLQMGWGQEEIEHIESLISFISKSESLFANSEIQQDKDQFELFMYVWMEYAQDVLNWDRSTIYSICGDPNKAVRIESGRGVMELVIPKIDEFMTIQQTPIIKTGSEQSQKNCTCSQMSDWCDIFGELPAIVMSCNNNKYDCKVVKKDCGLFWQFDCDGICKSPLS